MAMTKEEMAERMGRRKKINVPFSVTQYQDMKSDGIADSKIMEKHGLNPVQLNKWKTEHNLIGKHNVKSVQKERSEVLESKVTTNQPKENKPTPVDYEKFCGTKDKEIARLTAVNERQLADNQKLAEENEKLHKKLQEPIPGDMSIVDLLKTEIRELREKESVLASKLQTSQDGSELQENLVEELEEELHKWKSDHSVQSKIYRETLEGAAKLQDRIDKMQIELDIRSSEYALLENQLNNATKRIEDLKRFERDYHALEVMHSNMRARFHGMEDEVEETRAAMKILDSLYRGQSTLYLKSRDRLDELEAGE